MIAPRKETPRPEPGPILFIGHSAGRTGAPVVLLHLLRWLRANTSLDMQLILSTGGPLVADYTGIVPTQVLGGEGIARSSGVRSLGRIPVLGPQLRRTWHRIVSRSVIDRPPALIYANTIATAAALQALRRSGTPVVTHVHELEGAIQSNAGPSGIAYFRSVTTRYISASNAVARNLVAHHAIPERAITIVPSFVSAQPHRPDAGPDHRVRVREQLGIPANAFIVGGCGAVSDRKGTDLFVETAGEVRRLGPNQPVHFLWVGKIDRADPFVQSVLRNVAQTGLDAVVHFTGEVPEPGFYFAAIDAFALTSREEPFGIVALEAAVFEVPALCFADAGGLPEFVEDDAGYVVPFGDVRAMAARICGLIADEEECRHRGRCAHRKVLERHDVNAVAPVVLKCIEGAIKVSQHRD